MIAAVISAALLMSCTHTLPRAQVTLRRPLQVAPARSGNDADAQLADALARARAAHRHVLIGFMPFSPYQPVALQAYLLDPEVNAILSRRYVPLLLTVPGASYYANLGTPKATELLQRIGGLTAHPGWIGVLDNKAKVLARYQGETVPPPQQIAPLVERLHLSTPELTPGEQATLRHAWERVRKETTGLQERRVKTRELQFELLNAVAGSKPDPDRARALAKQLYELDPTEANWFETTGTSFANVGRWKEAADMYAQASQVTGLDEVRVTVPLLVFRARSGDLAGYRTLAEQVRAHLGTVVELDSLLPLIRDASLLPDTPPFKPAFLKDLATEAQQAPVTYGNLRSLALAFYRSGDYAGALKMIEIIRSSPDGQLSGPQVTDYGQLIAAMADWKLGHQEEARRSLAEAERNLDSYDQEHTGTYSALPANYRGEIDLIRQEADALIK